MIADLTLATGEQVHLSASAGGAAFPEQGEDFISLCRSADAALYNVKQNGKAAFKMKQEVAAGKGDWICLSIMPVERDEQGRNISVVCVCRPITAENLSLVNFVCYQLLNQIYLQCYDKKKHWRSL